jgi:hypothetical protein
MVVIRRLMRGVVTERIVKVHELAAVAARAITMSAMSPELRLVKWIV